MSKKNRIIICISFLLVLANIVWMVFNIKEISNRACLKFQWGVDIPLIKEKYTYNEFKFRYAICDCSASNDKSIFKDLYEQMPSESWKEEIRSGLKDKKIEYQYYPDFDSVNYCIKKTDGLSYIYLLYSSSTSTFYVYESID